MKFESALGVGIAYSGYTRSLLEKHPGAVDYVEVPFEHLRYEPSVLELSERIPLILHCASLSIAGTVPPSQEILEDVLNWAEKTRTPWIGEHLSFVTADLPSDCQTADECYPGEPFNLGYSISPPQNDFALECVIQSVKKYQRLSSTPLLLENPPLYFAIPGSQFSQGDFISRVCSACSADLLLDLAHFYITSLTMGFSFEEEALRLPLDRVVEVHLSGVDERQGGPWDNHASSAPEVLFDVLERILPLTKVRAITLEYNWSARYPISAVIDHVDRVRAIASRVIQNVERTTPN